MSSIVELSAAELSAAIRTRRVSCRNVMTAYLDRIDAANPAINAIVSLRERAVLVAEADACDAELARGRCRGWMHGFPHAVKDVTAAAGLRTTQGSPLLADWVPQHDAIIVERLRAAGAILIGKTNVPEFGLGSQSYNPVFGTTRNPYDRSRTAGGSSGGAAAALAARLVPVADGSDIMGSLRNPAAFCNVYGFRPSFGCVPSTPGADVFLHQLATDGPMARSVEDLVMLLATMAGYDRRVPLSLAGDGSAFAGLAHGSADLSGVRIGWLGDWGGHLPFEHGVLECCRAALRVFEALGCEVEELAPPFDAQRLWECWLVLRSVLVAGRLRGYYEVPEQRGQLKPEAQWEVACGLSVSALDLVRASETRTAWHVAALAAFERVDILAIPSAQLFAFDADLHWPRQVGGRAMETYHRWMEVVIAATLLGAPAISVPVGFGGPAQLPMGMQLIGAPRADLTVLRAAHAYDLATRWPDRMPPKL